MVPIGRTPGPEFGHAAVVLVADQTPELGRVDVVVADQARLRAPRRHIQHARAGDAHAVLGEELVAEHLVGAADGQEHDAVVGHRPQRGRASDEIVPDVALRGVLAASAEDDVGVVRQRIADD